MRDWDEVVAFALALPDVALVPQYGTPTPKLNGKALVGHSRETGSFGVHVDSIDTKRMLIDTDPATFWDTPHYANYPAVLVRYGSNDPERVERLIRRAWWLRARKAQRKSHPELEPHQESDATSE